MSAPDMAHEQARCRALILTYYALGPTGNFGRFMIEKALQEADAAIQSGDAARILRAYNKLRGLE